MKAVLLALAVSLAASFSWAHDEGENRVTIEPEAQGNYSAGIIPYSFQLFDTKVNKPLSDQDLVETNTKILHFIAYDSSRNEFNHVHPTFDGKAWNVELTLPANGKYYFWAQGQLKDGTEFSTFVNAQITSGKPEIPVTPLKDIRSASDRSTIVTLGKAKLKAGVLAMIDFQVSRNDGQNVQLSPYLGSMAHVIAVSPDGDELIHVHPMAGNAPNTGMIHASFPTAGDYRIWVQLIDRGVLKIIPLSVIVAK